MTDKASSDVAPKAVEANTRKPDVETENDSLDFAAPIDTARSDTTETPAKSPVVKNPEEGLTSQESLPDGSIQLSYKPEARADRLKEVIRRTVEGGNETIKTFEGRQDSLLSERTLVKAGVTETELKYARGAIGGLSGETIVIGKDGKINFELRNFDPEKNEQRQSYETVTRSGSTTTTAKSFSGRADGLASETITEDANGTTRIRRFADGTGETARKTADGLWVGTRTRADAHGTAKPATTADTLEMPNGATLIRSENGIEIRAANGSSINLTGDGQSTKLSIDGKSWTSTDGKTFKNADGSESFELTVLPNGDLRRDFKNKIPPEVEIRRTDGSVLVMDDKNRIRSAANQEGVRYTLDDQERITRSEKDGKVTTFEYDGQSQIPGSFTINGRRFDIARGQGDAKPPLVVSTARDGADGQANTEIPRIDESIHPAFKGATVRINDRHGRLIEAVRANGDRVQYGYSTDGSGAQTIDRPDRVTINSGGNTEVWSTTDGIKWEQSNADGSRTWKTWEGIKSVDRKTGELRETQPTRQDGALRTMSTLTAVDGARKVETRPTTEQDAAAVRTTADRSVNLDVRLDYIKRAADPSQRFTNEKADLIRRQLSDLNADEIRLLKHAFNPDDPEALGKFLQEQFKRLPYGGLEGQAHRWAEVEGNLKRTGEPGEDTAIQLKVDALEARWAGIDDFRNGNAIQANTRTTLLAASEEQRIHIEASLKRLYGVESLSQFYENGDGKNVVDSDEFTKTTVALASRKGVDARTPQEQSNLLHTALATRELGKFREVASKDSITAEGRKYFIENGGIEKIDQRKTAGRTTTYVFDQEIRTELKELAHFGEESPLTQFKKAIGVFSNVDSSLQDAVKRVAENPAWRNLYLDGRQLARAGQEPKTEEQRQALDFYQQWQKAFRDAHYFGTDRKATNYEAQIVSPDGAIASGQLFEHGASHWQHTSDLFKVVESASHDQLNALLDGARIKQPSNGATDRAPDAVQSDGLEDARQALRLSINGGTNLERIDKLMTDKVRYGVELNGLVDRLSDRSINQTNDTGSLEELKAKVPAFKDIPTERMQAILHGYRLDLAVRNGTIKPHQLTSNDALLVASFRRLAHDTSAPKNEVQLHEFLKGREVQRRVDGILQNDSLTASVKEKQVSEYLKSVGDQGRLNLESFRVARNDAIQTNARRDIKESIADAKDQQALVAAIKNATPQEQERFRNDPTYQKEIRDLTLRHAYNPASRQALNMLFDQYTSGKPMSKVDQTIFNTLEKLANRDQSPNETRQIILDTVRDALRLDKDGDLARSLATSESFKNAIGSLIGGPRRLELLVKPLLENGIASMNQLRRLHGSDLFKESILDGTRQGLKFLAGPEGKEQRDALLEGMPAERRALAEKIIDQGEVKPEDRFRAYVLGIEMQEAAIDLLKSLKSQERTQAVRNYHNAFKTSLHEDLLKKVDSAHRPFVDLLASENSLSPEQALVRAREAVTESTSTWLGRQGLKYDSTIFNRLSDLSLSVRDYNGQMPQEELDRRTRALAERLKSFDGSKDEIANLVVEGLVTAGAVLATPFTGGTSLGLLALAARIGAMSATGGLAGAFLKAHMTGDYDHLAGDLIKYSILTGANLAGGEVLRTMTGISSRAATKTLERVFADKAMEAVFKGSTNAMRDSLKKGLIDLIERGFIAGGVTDEAVAALVKTTQIGLSLEAQNALTQALIANLGKGITEVAADSMKASLINAARNARMAGYEGTAGFGGGFTGDLASQAVESDRIDWQRAAVNGIATFLFAGAARAGLDVARARLRPHENQPHAAEARPRPDGSHEPLKDTPGAPARVEGVPRVEAPIRSGELPDARLNELPPGSVEKIHERIQSMLIERNKIVDVSELEAIRTRLSGVHDEWIGLMGANPHITLPALSKVDEQFIKQLDPSDEASARIIATYNKYKDASAAENAIQSEFDLRAAELTRIVNEEARQAYPNGVFANLKVIRARDDGGRLGFFHGDGTIGITDAQLVPGYSTVATVLHEVKHAEQQGLIIRKLIDEVVPGNSKEALTDEQIRRVAELAKTRVNAELSPDIIKQIADQRAGQRLSGPELERANRLERSFQEMNEFHSEKQALKQRLNDVKRELGEFHFDDTQADDQIFSRRLTAEMFLERSLDNPTFLKEIFGDQVPESVTNLMREFDSLRGNGPLPDDFFQNAHPVLKKELKKVYDSVAAESRRHYEIYRNWAHEMEAHSISDEVKQRTGTLNPFETAQTVEAQLDRMFNSISADKAVNPENKVYAQMFIDMSASTSNENLKGAMRMAAEMIIDEPLALRNVEARQNIRTMLLGLADEFKDDVELQAAFRRAADVVNQIPGDIPQLEHAPLLRLTDQRNRPAAGTTSD